MPMPSPRHNHIHSHIHPHAHPTHAHSHIYLCTRLHTHFNSVRFQGREGGKLASAGGLPAMILTANSRAASLQHRRSTTGGRQCQIQHWVMSQSSAQNMMMPHVRHGWCWTVMPSTKQWRPIWRQRLGLMQQRKHVPCSVVGNLGTEHRGKRNASHRSPLRVITSVSENMVPKRT